MTASRAAARPRSPRRATGTASSTPRATESPGTSQPPAGGDFSGRGRFFVCMEDLLHGSLEEARDTDRQRQRGVVAAFLDGVDRLPRDPEAFAEGLLGPAPCGAQRANVVVHSSPRHSVLTMESTLDILVCQVRYPPAGAASSARDNRSARRIGSQIRGRGDRRRTSAYGESRCTRCPTDTYTGLTPSWRRRQRPSTSPRSTRSAAAPRVGPGSAASPTNAFLATPSTGRSSSTP